MCLVQFTAKSSPPPPAKPSCHFFQTACTGFFDPLYPISDASVCTAGPSLQHGQFTRGHMPKMSTSLTLFFLFFQSPKFPVEFIFSSYFHQYFWFYPYVSLMFSSMLLTFFLVLDWVPHLFVSSFMSLIDFLPMYVWNHHMPFDLFQNWWVEELWSFTSFVAFLCKFNLCLCCDLCICCLEREILIERPTFEASTPSSILWGLKNALY